MGIHLSASAKGTGIGAIFAVGGIILAIIGAFVPVLLPIGIILIILAFVIWLLPFASRHHW